MYGKMQQAVAARLEEISRAGLFKQERVGVWRGGVLNFCANNYLGLAHHPEVVKAAQEGLARWGFGMASVRFICGTETIHKELERRLSDFLGTEDAILYGSCFDANGGLFETLLDEQDAIVSDELNHASIIDGIRLSKAQRFRYRNSDMGDLEAKLREAAGARHILIATDGVFSMDGFIANLPEICELAERHGALVMVDDSHAVGFLGKSGRGTPEVHDVMGRHPHRHVGQGPGRRLRRLHCGPARDRGFAAATLAAVFVFEFAAAGHRRGVAEGARSGQRVGGAAPAAVGEYGAVSAGDQRLGLPDSAR
jgi:glycine C-acetyltransferase